jgi:flagellar hook-associated protein 3 FlgL
MAITRITQNMLSQRGLDSVQGGLTKLATLQEQLETGKKINRPSDDPAGTTTALRVRSGLADQTQYIRNAADGTAWLGTIDSALSGITSQVQRAQVLAQQGANTGSMSSTAMEALATEVDQIRASVLQQANTTYLGRPVFGGTTSGGKAFDTTTGNYVGDSGTVERRVGSDVTVRVDASGTDTFGTDGDNLFSHLSDLSNRLRAGDSDGLESSIATIASDLQKLSGASAGEGARYNRITKASDLATATQLQLKSSLSDVEDVDLAEATLNLATQQTAYQAALAAASKTLQPSLLDFLR